MKKTKTGLHIDVKGKRIEVYTKKELEKLESEANEKLDFVGKLENISNDFEYIKKILGIQESLKHLNKSNSNKLSYDEDAYKLITILYKEDIKLYNKDTAYTKF